MKGTIPNTTRHDPAADSRLSAPFTSGRYMIGQMKGSQSQYERISLDVATGSAGTQPALQGQYPHPIPPPKGDRW